MMRGLSKAIVTHVPELGAYACRCAWETASERHCHDMQMRDLARTQVRFDTELHTLAKLGSRVSFRSGLYRAALTRATILGRSSGLMGEGRRTAAVLVQALAPR